MNRAALCIQMLQMLKSRGFMSRDEIAQELEINKRNVAEFRKELEIAGYHIISTTGKYGGYALLSDALLPSAPFSEAEKQSLREVQTYLTSHPDFLEGKTACHAIDKILSNVVMEEGHPGFYIEQEQYVVSKTLRIYIDLMHKALKEQRCVELTYRSMKERRTKTFRIHPYEIIHYKGAYYCIAYSLLKKDYRTYKFSEERMKNCVLLDQYFQRDRDFELQHHIGTSGLMKEEGIAVTLEIYEEAAVLCAEKQIGLHPSFHWINENTLHYQTIFEGKKEAISFILSLGGKAKVLSPGSLCEEIMEQAKQMMRQYDENMQR